MSRPVLRSAWTCGPYLAIGCLMLVVLDAWAEENFQQLLDQASELNVTAPWQASQAILDRLAPRLDQASQRQYVAFHLLQARNRALAGDMAAGLESLEALLQTPMSDDQTMETLTLATNLAMLSSRYEEAFEYLNRALAIELDATYGEYLSGLLSLAAYITAQIGLHEQALVHGVQSLDRALDSGDMRSSCIAAQRLAFVWKTLGEYDEATINYQRALVFCEATGDEVLVGVTRYGLADVWRETGLLERARNGFDEALQQLEEVDFRPGISETRLGMARLEFSAGQLDRARDLLEPLADDFEQRTVWHYLALVHELLAEIALADDDPERALAHLDAHQAARERHLSRQRVMHLAYQEAEFHRLWHEGELSLLRESARLNELEQQVRRQEGWLRAVGVLILLLTGLALMGLLVRVRAERRRFRQLARRDGLTGLYNHSTFFAHLSSELARARRRGQPLILLLIDVDHFKRVNDTYGHLIGDRVLAGIATELRNQFGHQALLARVGGEEFAVALRGIDVAQALENTRHLKARLTKLSPVAVTVSGGLVQATPGTSPVELYAQADQILYQAKQGGRNTILSRPE